MSLTRGKHISGIVEKRKTQVISHVRQFQRRRPQLQAVDEHRFSAQHLSGQQVARSRLVEAKAPQSIGAAGKESFRQRNHRLRRGIVPWQTPKGLAMPISV